LAAPRAFAGAWTQPQNHFYLQLGTAFTNADQAYDFSGKLGPVLVRPVPNSDFPVKSNFQQLMSDLYFEYGIFNRVTLFTDLPITSMRQHNPGGTINYSITGIADLLFGLRAGVLVDPVAIAIEARMTAPAGDSNAVIPTGSGDFRGELRLAVAKAFERVPIYVDFEFGLTLRGSTLIKSNDPSMPPEARNYAPEVAVHGEVGGVLVRWKNVDRLMLTLMADYRGSTQRNNVTGGLFDLIPQNSELTTVGANLAWRFYRWFGILGRFTQAVQGKRLPQVTTGGAALFVSY
jgi:hypothetical protein